MFKFLFYCLKFNEGVEYFTLHFSFFTLKASLCRRQSEMIDVSAYSHFKCSCKSLEYSFYFVMFVFAFSLYVEVHASSIAKTLEEM